MSAPAGQTGRVTIIGGSGYVGQLLRRGLSARGYTVDVFDPVQGLLVNILRRRWFATAPATGTATAAGRLARAAQRWVEPRLQTAGLIRRGADDMLAAPELLARRFAGSRAVIHLAGIPHPHWPGATDETFVRLNYDAAMNVFEATRDAGVPTFVFASSAQVYAINNPVRLDQLPVLESNHLPLPPEGQTTYGFLKAAFERYLDGRCTTGSTQAVALRLECPGFRGPGAANLFVSTSIENTIDGFARAVSPPDDLGYDVFNLADADVDRAIVDIRAFVRRRWAYVPADLRGPNRRSCRSRKPCECSATGQSPTAATSTPISSGRATGRSSKIGSGKAQAGSSSRCQPAGARVASFACQDRPIDRRTQCHAMWCSAPFPTAC